MTSVFALLLTLVAPTYAQSELGTGPVDFGNDIPDLMELFRANPPMGTCPLGATDDRGPLPEASHLLHLGVPRFFTDYRRRLGLSDEQLETLRQSQRTALAKWTEHQSAIDAFEVRVWVLTGDPDYEERELEKVLASMTETRGAQRMAYIRAVRDAARVLTPEQRLLLTGSPRARTK